MLRITVLTIVVVCLVAPSKGAIYNWQTGEVIPGTENIEPGPEMQIQLPQPWKPSNDWRYAGLAGLDLHGSYFSGVQFDYASFAGTNLTDVRTYDVTLTGADFTNSVINGATFSAAAPAGFSASQLYSTASYKARDMRRIHLEGNLAGWDFAGQDLRGAYLWANDLSGAELTGSDVRGASFSSSLSQSQLYSTASYGAKDLRGVSLCGDLGGWSFSGQDLRGASFSPSDLSGAEFTDSDIRGATFIGIYGDSLTNVHLYSTASYKTSDLSGVVLAGIDVSGWSFAGQNMTGVSFSADIPVIPSSGPGTPLPIPNRFDGTDFSDAVITGASFAGQMKYGFTRQQLESTASYKTGNLCGIDLGSNDLSGWDLAGLHMEDASLRYAVLSGTSMVGTDLRGASFDGAMISGADLSGALITGASFRVMASGGIDADQLYSTTSYKTHDLRGIDLTGNNFSGWNFSGQNLMGTSFYKVIEGEPMDCPIPGMPSRFAMTDFTDALVGGTSFLLATSYGYAREQLYCTASYKSRDLRGIGLGSCYLTGWDLTGQAMTGADFSGAMVEGTDFRFADLRGANLAWQSDESGPIVGNTIWSDGSIAGLQLTGSEEMRIHNYNMAIKVNSSWTMTDGSVLRMVLEGDWLSVMNVGEGITPDLGGTLEFSFARGVDIASLIGTEFKLFNWNGRLAAGDCFDNIATVPGADWDTSRLYTDGVVTLVPEPFSLAIFGLGGLFVRRMRRR